MKTSSRKPTRLKPLKEIHKGKTCSRCHKWHQRLFHVWDNMAEADTLICLSCIAELTQERMTRFLPIASVKEMLEDLAT